MDEERLVRLIKKFMALGEEFLELIRDLDLDYDDLDEEPPDEEEELDDCAWIMVDSILSNPSCEMMSEAFHGRTCEFTFHPM